jgi:hypothetical protein
MTNSIVSAKEDSRKAEKECGDWIIDNNLDDITKFSERLHNGQFILIHCNIIDEDLNGSYTYTAMSPDELNSLNNESIRETGRSLIGCNTNLLMEYVNACEKGCKIPILIKWSYSSELVEISEDYILHQPLTRLTSIKKPFEWAPEPVKKPSTKKPSTKPLEKDLESELLNWMHSRGIQSDSQIQTSKHRMDLWIPGKCFLELKKGKVSGDDVCQAIDYCAEYKLPVVLVGNHIGDMASRGIEAFNKAVDGDLIAFVQWSAIRTYLKGLMSL